MSLYTPQQIAWIKRYKSIPASLWEFRFASETVRAWNGNVDRVFDGFRWQGMRGLIEAPNVPFPHDGGNQTALFTVRGMRTEIETLMWDHDAEVDGRYLVESEQLLAGESADGIRALQPIGPRIGTMIYVMRGVQSSEVAATEDGQERVFDLSILVELLTSARAEASWGRYTTADQAARYPEAEDNIFSDIPSIAAGQTVKLF